MKRNKAKQLRLPLIGVTITLAILFYWVWLFYITQPATSSNTQRLNEIITSVKVSTAAHRGTDKLLLFTDDRCYILDTGWKNENASNQLAAQISSAQEELTMIAWKHFPKNLLASYNTSLTVWQITDIRSSTNIYWDASTHNNYQHSERVTGIITGVFLSLIVITFDFLAWCSIRKIRS